MVTVEQVLVHPLFLLFIGAVVSFVLGNWLTNRYQNNMKKLDIKVDILSKIDEAIDQQMGKAISSVSQTKKKVVTERSIVDENNMKWFFGDAQRIESKLDTYFSEKKLKDRWNDFAVALSSFAIISEEYFIEYDNGDAQKMQKNKLTHYLEHISKYFSDNGPGDWSHIVTEMMTFNYDLYITVGGVLMAKGDDIKRDIIKTPIEIF